MYLFILTILSIITYRIISGYLIYLNTGVKLRILSQLLDLELFRTLYINFILNKCEPCDPQKWISGMEATFESAPQALIQFIYLTKTKSWTKSLIVLVSFAWSMISIISKQITGDKRLVSKGEKFGSNPLWYLIRFIWRFCDVSCRIFMLGLIWLSMGGTALFLFIAFEAIIFGVISYKKKKLSLYINDNVTSSQVCTQMVSECKCMYTDGRFYLQ